MKKPVIALTTRPKNKEGKYELSAQYTNAVKRAGGIPLLVPPSGKFEEELFEIVDGIILTGGGDIDPVFYGGESHAKIYGLDEERDEFEIPLAREIVKRKIPALPICRGIQVLNVALGGTLIEHLPDATDGSITHRVENPEGILHSHRIEKTSKLFGIIGHENVQAVSWHHQAVKDIAPDLIPVAFAPDGIVEALEMKDHPFLIAVQWHPEMSADHDAIEQRLFDALIQAASARGE